ncbi:hypothetical protein [Streptomyces roseifaciens]|uniref:hypothetical protein n=1 Tax=Streptomyces roseifaciens TaxID=1488406 RepID=UPI00071807F0|nr:hypothetical protein [Streptomyces roseifaciens]
MTNTTIALPTLLRLTDPGLREQLEALPASAALIGIQGSCAGSAPSTSSAMRACAITSPSAHPSAWSAYCSDTV